jgi:hypothetical protein
MDSKQKTEREEQGSIEGGGSDLEEQGKLSWMKDGRLHWCNVHELHFFFPGGRQVRVRFRGLIHVAMNGQPKRPAEFFFSKADIAELAADYVQRNAWIGYDHRVGLIVAGIGWMLGVATVGIAAAFS